MTADAVGQPLDGSFDVAVLKAFLNILSPEDARGALGNIGRVVNPGGAIIVAGGLDLDDSRLAPPLLVPFNLVMINIYEAGQMYTEQEHRDWLTEAGFVEIRRQSDVGFIARKP
jgi:SAM-dependent methyltransferase